MKVYVYCIYFPTSKRLNPYYIGIAKNLERRMLQHFNFKYQIGNALNKYDDWVIKKLHTCRTYDEAFRIEIEEIRNFDCVAPNGYNMTRGGEGGDTRSGTKCSKETIEKIRTSAKGNKSAEGHQNTKGKHWKNSLEFCEKHKGKKNVAHRVDVKIKKLKKHILRLEKEIEK